MLPLYLWTARPLRIARFIGHGPADQLGPVCGPYAHATAAEGFRSVATQAHLDLALAELLPGGEGWPELLGARADISGTLVLSDYTRKAIAG